MHIFWHRRDLRIVDNRGLATAAHEGATVVGVSVFDPDVLEFAGPPRVAFLRDALAALREAYRERGGDLLVVEGDPREMIPEIASRYDAEAVAWNRDYSGLARERDDAVAAALARDGVAHASHEDALFHKPGSITTNAGDHYVVFSYFYKKWRDRAKDDPESIPDDASFVSPEVHPIPTLSDLGVEPPEASIPPAGSGPSRDALDDFCDGPIYDYAENRDYPGRDATSRLSVHLKFGTVGPREMWAATDRADADAPDSPSRDSVESFQRQLAWRDFYAHVLAARPGVVTNDYRPFERGVAWRDDPEALQAWKDGRTGYPIVDAGMRQLRAEAWMHNRVRMIAASFLTKDLLIDWRAGYDWFREKLVDHDAASDAGGWQWAAGTGADAQPYFRIFNPVTQGERYDPDAAYIESYVRELRDVDPDLIHRWPDLDDTTREKVAPGYPNPIVDHAAARERALATFRRARGEN